MRTIAIGRCLIGGLLLLAAGTVAAAPTLSFTATPASISAGGQAQLNWTATDVRRCSASGAWSGSRPMAGSAMVGPLNATSTFTLRCWGRGGSITRSVQVSVVTTPAPTVTLSAAPSSIAPGGSSTLTWSSTNATSCVASGAWSGSRTLSGTQTTGALAANATYTLTCSGTGGSATRTATVTVTATPKVSISASPANVASGGSSTLTWSSTGVSTCTASGGWTGTKAVTGTAVVGPLTQDATYALNCSGVSGSAVAMTSVAVRVARLSWTAPTRYSDGSALTPAGYRIYYGTASKSYSQSVSINGASTTQWVLSLPAGTWFFVVTALDAAGKESVKSNEAKKTIN